MRYLYKIIFILVFLVTAYAQFYHRLPDSLRVFESSSLTPTAVPSFTPTPSVPVIYADQEIIKGMTAAFAKKYNRSATDFTLTVSDKDATHAKGMVQIKNEMGGGIWFGALSGETWVLAFDGNGIVDCAAIDPYNFSKNMIPSCIDTVNGNSLIQR